MHDKDKRVVYTDFLRIAAMAAVMIIHIAAWNINLAIGTESQIKFYSFMMGASRWSVPIFVMVSGVFMLNPNKQFNLRQLYQNNIARLVSCYFIWSLFYALFDNRSAVIDGDLSSIPRILSATVAGHDQYWFILMMIGLYIVTPILRIFVVQASKKELEYFLLISFLFSCVFPVFSIFPQLTLITNLILKMEVLLPVGFTFYYVMGYYLNRYDVEHTSTRRLIYGIGLLGTIVAAEITYMITTGNIKDTAGAFSYLNAAIAVTAIAGFIFGKRHFEFSTKYHQARKIIFKMAKYSFGMYLSHDLFNRLALKFEVYNYITNSMVLLFLMLIMNFIGSFVIITVVDKIPVIRKYCM